jgi:hypothetical protein
MRKLFLFMALTSAPAFAACPNITGQFNCTDGNGNYQETFATSVDQNGVTTYTLDQTQVVADGQPRPVPGTLMPNGKYTATCDAVSKVLVHIEGPYAWGSTSGYLKFDISTFYVGSYLEMDQHQDFLPVEGPEQFSDVKLTCTPAP